MKQLLLLIAMSLSIATNAQTLIYGQQKMKNPSNSSYSSGTYVPDTVNDATTIKLIAREVKSGTVSIDLYSAHITDSVNGTAWVMVSNEPSSGSGTYNWKQCPGTDTVSFTNPSGGVIKAWKLPADFLNYAVFYKTTKSGQKSAPTAYIVWKGQR